MEIRYHKSTRGIWVFIDGKHKKTISSNYESAFKKNIDKINFDKKYLQDAEKDLLDEWYFNDLFSEFNKELKIVQPLIAKLVEKANVKGVRFVNSKNGDRYELCFDNGIKIKCNRKIYLQHPNKLETVYLNY